MAIAGAGNVGQSIARALLGGGHKVLLIERHRPHYRPELVSEADWMLGDACELAVLTAAGIQTADVVIAATGDDKVNLVFAVLCKTEFAVPRVLARINDFDNQWLFTGDWGVDVAVSAPLALVAAAKETVSTGEVVPLMTLPHGECSVVEFTLPAASPLVGRAVTDLGLPDDAAPLAILRGGELLTPAAGLRVETGDELVLLVASHVEDRVRANLATCQRHDTL